jgi:hypothetical protein
MNIEIIENNGKSIAAVTAEGIVISTLQDAVDIIGNCYYQGAEGIIMHQHNIDASFFDLKTRFAGEVLQKFSTYQMRLAIVGDFSQYTSSSLRDFILESNKAGRINFVSSIEEANEKLAK